MSSFFKTNLLFTNIDCLVFKRYYESIAILGLGFKSIYDGVDNFCVYVYIKLLFITLLPFYLILKMGEGGFWSFALRLGYSENPEPPLG